MPAGYTAQKTFFSSLRNTGVNTLNRDLTLSDAGFPAIEVIPIFRDQGDHRIDPPCGGTGIGDSIKARTYLNQVFTNKLFRK